MAKPPAFSGFEELEAIVDEALAEKREAEGVRKARDRIIAGAVGREQLAEDAARVRAWEDANVWRNVALVALFIEQGCEACGDYQYFLTGRFVRQADRRQATTRRWVCEEEVDAGVVEALPKEIMRQFKAVPMCAECCEGVGFRWLRSYYDTDNPDEAINEADNAEARAEAIAATLIPAEIHPGVAETPWPFDDIVITVDTP